MQLLIAGDFCPHERVADLVERGQFKWAWGGVKHDKELTVINFESCIADDGCQKIEKLGPHLKCSEKVIKVLKDMDVDVVTLANNHTFDYGEQGLLHTMSSFQSNGIKTVGAGKNLKESGNTLYVEKKGETVALINCCEHEFSYAEDNKAGTNPLNPISQFNSIREAKERANYVVVIVHGGHEYFDLPSLRMKQTYRFFVDAGADAVINHHQHCYSGFETYNGKPIYYGLGNFCFDWKRKDSSWNSGYLVRLYLGESITSEVIPYIQCAEKPTVEFIEPDNFKYHLEMLNHIIQNENLLREEIERYYKKSMTDCIGVMTPFSNRYLNALVRRGLFPSFIIQRKKLLWKAYVDCEAHRDKMLYYLKN